MPFWSGETLLARGKALFSDFDEKRIDCNAYALRMGGRYYLTADTEQSERPKITTLPPGEALVIPAGQFAFLLTKETITIPPSAMAFISMRTPTKFHGLINVSGFNVDPGYSGRLIYAVYNASPSSVMLTEGEPVFKIWLCDIDRTSKEPYIKKSDQGHSDITPDIVRGMGREILSLQSLAEKLRAQDKTIDAKFTQQDSKLENLAFVWRALQIGVFVGIVGAILAAIVSFVIPITWGWGQDVRERLWPVQQLNQPVPPPTTGPGTVQPPVGGTTP